MATKKPLVWYGGRVRELASGDTVSGTGVTDTNSVPEGSTNLYFTDERAVVAVTAISNVNGDFVTIYKGMPICLIAGQFRLANAGSSTTYKVVGVVMDTSIVVGGSGKVQTTGIIRATTAEWDAVTGQVGGLSVNGIYFLDTTSGRLTTTPPTNPGETVIRVGHATKSTEMKIQISQPIRL